MKAERECHTCKHQEWKPYLPNNPRLYPVCNIYKCLCPTVMIQIKFKECEKWEKEDR